MKNYLGQTTKSKKIVGIKTYNWGIPAFRAKDGFVTCPSAKDCVKGCYARQFFYNFPKVKAFKEECLALTQTHNFISTINSEIKRRKILRLRVHDSGDFYSNLYALNWIEIATRNPQTQFYSYTKQISLAKELKWPENFCLVYSVGGKFDHLIDDKVDRHSKIFLDHLTLRKSGYADASFDDSVALGKNHRIGLVYHGHDSKKFQTL